MKNFAKNLNEIMIFLEISQVELSHKTGLTQACISQYCNGTREPSLTNIIRLLNALGVKFERLIKK